MSTVLVTNIWSAPLVHLNDQWRNLTLSFTYHLAYNTVHVLNATEFSHQQFLLVFNTLDFFIDLHGHCTVSEELTKYSGCTL